MSQPLDSTSTVCANTFLPKLDTFIVAIETMKSKTALIRSKTSLSCELKEWNEMRTHIELCKCKIQEIAVIQGLVQLATTQSREWKLDERGKLMVLRVAFIVHKMELQNTVREFDDKLYACSA